MPILHSESNNTPKKPTIAIFASDIDRLSASYKRLLDNFKLYLGGDENVRDESKINPGATTHLEIEKTISNSDIILLLPSIDFLASDNLYSIASGIKSSCADKVITLPIRRFSGDDNSGICGFGAQGERFIDLGLDRGDEGNILLSKIDGGFGKMWDIIGKQMGFAKNYRFPKAATVPIVGDLFGSLGDLKNREEVEHRQAMSIAKEAYEKALHQIRSESIDFLNGTYCSVSIDKVRGQGEEKIIAYLRTHFGLRAEIHTARGNDVTSSSVTFYNIDILPEAQAVFRKFANKVELFIQNNMPSSLPAVIRLPYDIPNGAVKILQNNFTLHNIQFKFKRNASDYRSQDTSYTYNISLSR